MSTSEPRNKTFFVGNASPATSADNDWHGTVDSEKYYRAQICFHRADKKDEFGAEKK